MAARKNKLTLGPKWRDNIRAGILMDLLYRNALGKKKLNSIQQKSAQIIVNKLEPDLLRTAHTGKDGGAIDHHWTVEVVRPKK